MSDCERIGVLLDDYLSGTLRAGDRTEVERHLEACPTCAREAETLRRLLADARALPRSIAPPRDLWRGIDARLEEERPARSGRRFIRVRPRLLAAAAVVLVAVTAAVAVQLARPPAQAPLAGGPAVTAPRYAAVAADYAAAVRELEASFVQRYDRLPPETRAVVSRNLAVIDTAIAEARAALAAAGPNPDLETLLWASYRAKLDLLGRATKL
ncbi:MAG: zf-HC2 domain-containing protein [Gemmatimonadota bacterium]|nr:zf-HC2 domain-containing protein [Gemmatimonadota bacterium]